MNNKNVRTIIDIEFLFNDTQLLVYRVSKLLLKLGKMKYENFVSDT